MLAANAKVPSSLIGVNGVIFDDVLTGLPFTGASLANAQWNLAAFDSVGRTRLLLHKVMMAYHLRKLITKQKRL